MTQDAHELNGILARTAPAVARCLSPLGRRLAFPRGIPFQADEARHTEINATIGQLTDGRGNPMPLPRTAQALANLEPRGAFLYAPVEGPLPVRQAWLAHQRRVARDAATPVSVPFVTHGLTHGISIVADLFADPDTDVIVPAPAWENYELLFDLHAGARITSFPFFGTRGFNLDGLEAALAGVRKKAVIVLNFPGNPTGYLPSREEAAQIVEILTSWRGPGVVVLDDAYQGWVYDDAATDRSLFWDLAEKADPERLFPIKVDGATKELLFFSSRVGFLTHTATGEAEAALLSKLKCHVRGTVGSASGPALAAVADTLADPGLAAAFEERRRVLAGRHHALRAALDALGTDRLVPYPFNAAFFALLQVGVGLDAETLRRRLIEEHSVGTIAFREQNALRIAYCSIDEAAIPELVHRLGAAVR